ncbi:galactokinase [Coemansia sp. RSA 988]|nr:galactokinase [Coemansia sp. RSA 988]
MSESVPLCSSLSEIYTNDLLKHGARFQSLTQAFIDTYGFKPSFIARAPGCVNIIGEHIDYCGFPVFPMAIVPDFLIAVRATDESLVRLANLNPKYEASTFSCAPHTAVTINKTQHEWTNYFKCGYKGAIDAVGCAKPYGMQCLIDSSVPASSGLSGSSALVCSALLATMKVNGKALSQRDIVEIAVACERLIGINGGGMDQTASIMSHPQSAMFIEFDPVLRVTPVKFPSTTPPIAFVIANTLVVSDKAVTASVCYNLRVVETRIGALLLAKHLGIADRSVCKDVDPLTFKIVMDEYLSAEDCGGSDCNSDNDYDDDGKTEGIESWISRLDTMLKEVQKAFGTHPEGYTREEMALALNMTPAELSAAIHEDKFPVQAEKFKLLQRAQHAFSEALRVVRFRQICESGDTNTDYFQELGELMNQSQDSCRDLFECSCDELDELCSIARRAGAFGSRLTGAGWGGCTVHLIPASNVDGFIAVLKEEFYAKHTPELKGDALDDAVFVTAPASGAAFYEFS